MRSLLLALLLGSSCEALCLPAPRFGASALAAAPRIGASALAAAPLVAWADAIDDIAARSNEAAAAASAAKAAKAAAGSGVEDFAAGALNLGLSAATLALVGGALFFLLSIRKEGADTVIFTKDPSGNSPATYQSTFGKEEDLQEEPAEEEPAQGVPGGGFELPALPELPSFELPKFPNPFEKKE